MNEARFQQILRRAFLLPLVMSAVLACTLFFEVQVLVKRALWVEHSDQVISVSQRLYRLRVDQESALRAYLLTDDGRFLQEYQQVQEQASRLEENLRNLITDNPEQQARNETAIRAHVSWMAFATQALSMMPKLGEDVTDPQFQMRGKLLMDNYRRARADFFAEEERLRDQRIASSKATLRLVNMSVVGLCLLIGLTFATLGRKQLLELSQAFKAALSLAEANAREARAQREWFQTTLTSIGDAVIATDAAGRVSFMNPVAQKLTGWALPEAEGKPLAEVFRIVNERTREAAENPVEKVRRLNHVVGLANHTVLIARDGAEFSIDDSGAPIRDAAGGLAGVVLVFRDVTQQRRLEGALLANERMAVAGRLSASIAHEIHNPLDTVSNLLFLLQQQTSALPEAQQLIGTALSEVGRVAQISRNMLSLYRNTESHAPIRLSELLDGVVGFIRETLIKGRRDIRVEHGFQGTIDGSSGELRQVFTNVIKNAVEATTDGGRIRILTVAAREADSDGVLVHVIDDGAGIHSQVQSRLFTPFTTTKPESGTGLGLWVSRSIVQKHGGSIRIAGSADAAHPGTTVSIFLPLRPMAQSQGESQPA